MVSIGVGRWHFAEPFTCVLCQRIHAIDRAVELNRSSPKPERPPWGYFADVPKKAA